MRDARTGRIDAIAASQLGLITRPQLLGLGVPGRTIANWVRSGRLQRAARGV